MANFLDDLSIYNAKAAAAISLAVTQGDSPKANLMSSLKTTANDITLTEAVRLNALTALINVGSLLDVPLPPYFPVVSTFANSQTYVGVHNDLSGLNVGDYQHLTAVEKAAALNKASLSDISFANLIGTYTDNASLVAGFATKQNALSGTGYVKASGGTITYDNSTFLTAVTGIVAADTPGGGQLTGTYASPVLSNAAVIAKVLTGFNPSAPTGVISSTDSIISAIQKLNANVDSLAASSGTINEITFSLPSSVFSYTAGPFTSGAAPLSGTFVNQSQNRFFAGPSSGGSGQPTFRAIVAGDFPVSGATAGTYGSSSSIPVVQVDAYGRVTNISSVASASGGQVNTITYSVPAGVFTSTVTGTTAVGITLGLSTQTANRVWAGPASGVAATPGFRSLVAADIPNIAISQVTSLQSQLDSKMTYSLNDGEIFIGSIANAPAMKSLTGDVTMTREGVVTIAGESVTFSKMQEITSGTLLGRWGAADPGPIQEVGLSADFILDGGTGILSLAVPVAPILDTKGSLITYRSSVGAQVQLYAGTNGQILIPNNTLDDGLEWVSMSGDVTLDTTTPSGAATISAGAVTLAKMANLAANSFIGNNTGSSATPIALTVTEATAMLNQFTTSAKGLVPAASFTPASGKTLADYFLNASGAWSLGGGGGGGSGTVTTVSVVSANGFAGTVANATTTPAITLTTSITGLLKGNGTAISAATSGTDYAPATSGTSILYGNGAGGFSNVSIGTGLSFSTGTLSASGSGGTVTSVGLTMPSAFSVTPSTITTSGTFAVTGAGTVSQYVRGDGTLANFPASGGGGSSLSYYLNGSVTQFGTYKQMNRVPVNGAGTNFTLNNTTGYQLMAQFVTDANDPSLLNIPAGAWDIGFYFSSSSTTGSPAFYVELLKYDGTNFTTIVNNSANAEIISNGTAVDLYNTSLAVPSTSLTLTDRLVIRVYVNTAGNRTITFHTEDNNLAQIITTFTTGLTALNGLTAQVQFLANGSTGTAPAFVSSTATHTLNIPLASASSVTAGLISKTEYDTFNGKLANVLTTTGDIIYSSSGTTAARLGIGTANQVLAVSAGLIPEWKTIAAGGDVTGPAGPVIDGNFAVFDSTTGKIIKESAGASLSAAGAAVFYSSVTVGVSGVAPTGQLIFRNATTAATTTFLASTSQSANLIYTWPITAPTVGQILSSDASGNLSWTAAGAGNVTTGGTQTFTGTNTFNANAIRINNATNNGYHILASLAGAAGTLTATFPAATGTVPLLSLAQTFTAAQTFQANITVGGGSYNATLLDFTGTTSNRINFSATPATAPATNVTPSAGTRIVIANTGNASGSANSIGFNTGEMWLNSDISGAISFYNNTTRVARFTLNYLEILTSGATIRLEGATSNTIRFNTNGSGAPAYSSSGDISLGTRIIFYPIVSGGANSYAMGVNGTNLWTAGATSYSWYGNSNAIWVTIDTNGISTTALGAFNLINTVATSVNFAGAATTLTIGNTATAAQTVNMFTASTGASTYNFATGATANATTKAINIGTGGAAGSTTNITFGTSTTTNLRFFGSANTSGKPTVSGSRGGNAALASFLTAMSNLGLITDSTTA